MRYVKRAPSLVLALLNLALIAMATIALILLGPRADPITMQQSTFLRIVVGAQLLLLALFVVLPLLALALAVFDWIGGLRRAALAAFTIAAVLLLVPTSFVLGGRRLAASQEQRVERDWARTTESMEVFLTRYPDASISMGALGFEAAAARVGIEMNAFETRGAPRTAHGPRVGRTSIRAYAPASRGCTRRTTMASPSRSIRVARWARLSCSGPDRPIPCRTCEAPPFSWMQQQDAIYP